ncbi:MAG: hypothetical protein ACR2PT_06290 [Endozoicomonas sp.]
MSDTYNQLLAMIETVTRTLRDDWRKDAPELISSENSAEALLEKIKTGRAIMASKNRKPKRRVRIGAGRAA